MTDIWILLIPVSSLLDEGFLLQDIEKCLETSSGEELITAAGSASVLFPVPMGSVAHVPAGQAPITFYYNQQTKIAPSMEFGYAMTMPIFIPDWVKACCEEREVQAITSYNMKWLKSQAKDIYKDRCAVASEFFTACGGKVV